MTQCVAVTPLTPHPERIAILRETPARSTGSSRLRAVCRASAEQVVGTPLPALRRRLCQPEKHCQRPIDRQHVGIAKVADDGSHFDP